MSEADDGADRSLGQLVAAATTELSALMHDEIALAKAELRESAKRSAVGGSAASVAGVLILFSLPVLSFALAYGLRAWTGLGLAWCFLIVGGVYWLLAGLLGGFALLKLKKVRPPRRSIAAAKETAAVLGNAKPHQRATEVGAVPATGVAVAGSGVRVHGGPSANGGPVAPDVTRSSA